MNSLLLRALLAAALPSSIRAQSDNFNDLNDTGWTRYQPLAAYGAAASYSFTGGVYRIASAPSPDEGQLGPARAGAVRPESYGTFCVMVDIVAWDPAEDTSMGILARIKEVGLGTTDGYAFTYQGKDGDVQISRVDNEAPTDLSGTPNVTLTPGGNYRMVFFGIGGQLEGRIYDMTNPLTPVVTATGFDTTYPQGTCGLVVFADENTRASAGFDNYLANDGRIAPPVLAVDTESLRLTWDLASGLAHVPEWSVDLDRWSPLTTQGVDGGLLYYNEPFFAGGASPQAYYRLRLGATVGIGAR